MAYAQVRKRPLAPDLHHRYQNFPLDAGWQERSRLPLEVRRVKVEWTTRRGPRFSASSSTSISYRSQTAAVSVFENKGSAVGGASALRSALAQPVPSESS